MIHLDRLPDGSKTTGNSPGLDYWDLFNSLSMSYGFVLHILPRSLCIAHKTTHLRATYTRALIPERSILHSSSENIFDVIHYIYLLIALSINEEKKPLRIRQKTTIKIYNISDMLETDLSMDLLLTSSDTVLN